MATINSKHIIDEMIANNGHYEDDPQVYSITEYTNAFGGITWGVVWDKAHARRYEENPPYVNNPKVIWCRE